MEKCSVTINKELVNELTKKNLILALAVVIGSFLVVVGVTIYLILSTNYFFIAVIAIFGFLFAFGLVLLFFIIRNRKSASKKNTRIDTEFFDDYFISNSFNEENAKIQEVKLFYKDMLNLKVTKNYIFFFLDGRSVWPLARSEELLEFLKSKGIKQK